MSIKIIFRKIGDEFAIVTGKLPHNWVTASNDLLSGLEKAQTLLASPGALTVAALFPKGIGIIALADLQKIIADALPAIEIAQGCQQVIAGITKPQQKADALLAYIQTNFSKLPVAWHEKHWFNIAETILSALLSIPLQDAKLLLISKISTQ